MNPIYCDRCGCPNGAAADLCERCRARLPDASASRAAAPAATFGPHANARASYPTPPFAPYGVTATAPAAPLPAVSSAAPAAPHAPALASGRLPVDFPSTPFQGIGDALRPTLRLYREDFILVGKIVLAAALPLSALHYALAPSAQFDNYGEAALGWLASLLVGSLADGALIYAVVTKHRTNQTPSLAEAYGWGFGKWWPVFLCTLLTTVITYLGLVLLVVPGVILSLMMAVALPAVVVENRGPVEAIARSARLTEGSRVLILFTVVLLWVFVAIAQWLAADPAAGGRPFFASFGYAAVAQMLASAYTVLSLYIYLGLRADRGETVSIYDAPPPGGARP